MPPPDGDRNPADASRALREQALSLAPNATGITPGPGHEHVWAVLMESGYAAGVASLVTVADGTTSLYFSNGGGIIGAGQHKLIRQAANAFIAAVDKNVKLFAPAAEHPYPEAGRVRFYVRTFDGLLSAEAGEAELGSNRHQLSPLFRVGHIVIAAMHQAGAKS